MLISKIVQNNKKCFETQRDKLTENVDRLMLSLEIPLFIYLFIYYFIYLFIYFFEAAYFNGYV